MKKFAPAGRVPSKIEDALGPNHRSQAFDTQLNGQKALEQIARLDVGECTRRVQHLLPDGLGETILIEGVGQHHGAAGGRQKLVDDFGIFRQLGFAGAKLLHKGTFVLADRQLADPIVDQAQALLIDYFRAEMRHVARAYLGHAIIKNRAERVARSKQGSRLHVECSLGRSNFQGVCLVEGNRVAQFDQAPCRRHQTDGSAQLTCR